MSALAAAKKRRSPPPPPLAASSQREAGGGMSAPVGGPQMYARDPQTYPNARQAPGLTIHQVVELVDKRLTQLETASRTSEHSAEMEAHISESIEETDRRFEMLAEEIDGLKTLLLGLQSYTMGVNKMLIDRLDSRDGIISDVGAGFEMKGV